MSALRKLRQKDGCEFKASWSYQVTPCLKTKENYRIAHTKATFILKSKKKHKESMHSPPQKSAVYTRKPESRRAIAASEHIHMLTQHLPQWLSLYEPDPLARRDELTHRSSPADTSTANCQASSHCLVTVSSSPSCRPLQANGQENRA